MRVHLEYGRNGLDVELPDRSVVGTLSYKSVSPLADPDLALLEVLQNPTGSPSLAQLATGRRDACILICDVTRPVPNEMLLRPILRILEASGIGRDQILILIATGLHRPNEGDELVEMVGRFIAENYRIENHHGQQLDEHTYLGHSPRGVPIWLDTRYVQAELKIAVGLIEPHFMAGFSGGRKLIWWWNGWTTSEFVSVVVRKTGPSCIIAECKPTSATSEAEFQPPGQNLAGFMLSTVDATSMTQTASAATPCSTSRCTS